MIRLALLAVGIVLCAGCSQNCQPVGSRCEGNVLVECAAPNSYDLSRDNQEGRADCGSLFCVSTGTGAAACAVSKSPDSRCDDPDAGFFVCQNDVHVYCQGQFVVGTRACQGCTATQCAGQSYICSSDIDCASGTHCLDGGPEPVCQ